MTAERTVERLPNHCLSTVCRSPHTPLCVAQHRCCARLGSLDLCWLPQNNRRRVVTPRRGIRPFSELRYTGFKPQ